jgi:hypothetical protein
VCQRVAAIPMKRAAPAETRFLERDEVAGRVEHLGEGVGSSAAPARNKSPFNARITSRPAGLLA